MRRSPLRINERERRKRENETGKEALPNCGDVEQRRDLS
jgi:hypothetical protein